MDEQSGQHPVEAPVEKRCGPAEWALVFKKKGGNRLSFHPVCGKVEDPQGCHGLPGL
jgi:hypothetical protein